MEHHVQNLLIVEDGPEAVSISASVRHAPGQWRSARTRDDKRSYDAGETKLPCPECGFGLPVEAMKVRFSSEVLDAVRDASIYGQPGGPNVEDRR